MSLKVKLGPEIINSYKRLSYTHWHALAEFIDNSTQAYFENREVLDAEFLENGTNLKVEIKYDKERQQLSICDNSIGMTEAELQRALTIGLPPENTEGRSKYGLGLKTAACWFGDKWSIKTKKLGETEEVYAVFDVEKVSKDPDDVESGTSSEQDEKSHYTEIVIEELNRDFQARTVGKIKSYISSMFRIDLNNFLEIYWQGELLSFNYDDIIYNELIKGEDDEPIIKEFEFNVDEKEVHGWAGVFESGSRRKAGFSIIQHNRVIRTWPNSYKPENIYGEQEGGSNNLISQRLVGELYMDDFDVSHTKDEILYDDNEEDILTGKLEEEIIEFINLAKEFRKFSADQRDTSEGDTEEALNSINSELKSPEFSDLLDDELPNEDLVHSLTEALIEETRTKVDPAINLKIGDLEILLYLNSDLSPNDPYILIDATSHDSQVIVIANTRHPHWSYLKNEISILNFLRHSVYDGVAEWKCHKKAGEIRPYTVKKIKDNLLRLPYLMEGVDFS